MTIGGLVLSAAGGLAQGVSQQQYVKAQNKANQQAYQASKAAREAEQGRQKVFEEQATGEWQKTLDALTPEQRAAQEAEASKKFMTQYDTSANDQVSGQLLSGQDSASGEVKNAINEQIANAAKATRERVAALAALSGGGSVDVARGLKLGDNGNLLSTINGLRRGSLGVAQQEQAIQPGVVTPGSNILGQILTGAGGIMTGMGGAPAATASPMARLPVGSFAPGLVPHAARVGA